MIDNKSTTSASTYKKLFYLLGFICILLYSNTLNHNYVLDDFSVIKENQIVQKGIDGIGDIWKTHYRYGSGFRTSNLYRPLTLSIFALQWEIAPDQPALAHAFNILMYLILCLLLFKFLLISFGENHILLAFLSTLVFIAHPIHTEVVANIKSLDELLATSLFLSSILILFNYLKEKKIHLLVLSLFLVLLAFFAKESTATLIISIPFILVLLKKIQLSKTLRISALFLIPFGIYLLARNKVLGALSQAKETTAIDNILVAAPDKLTELATAIKILGFYLWKLILPHPLMNDYSFEQIKLSGFDNIYVWLSIAAYMALIYLFFKFRKSNSIIAFAIAFYLINLSLYSNLFFTIGTSFGERLLFLPSLGFSIAVAYLIGRTSKKSLLNLGKLIPKKPLIIASALVILYSFKTIDRNSAWKDNFTLYATDVKNCDESARCHYYMGLGFMRERAIKESSPNKSTDYLQKALLSFNKAIQIYPSYSDAWGQKGLAHFRLQQFKDAEQAYLKSTEINPGNATSLSNLGSLYFSSQQYQAAKTSLQKAIKVNPNHIDAIANYAATLGTLGEFNEAVIYFKRAIEIQPNQANYYQMLGATYQNLGDTQQANYYLQKAAQMSAKN